MSISLGIIGGGVMAEAILSRLLSTSLYQAETVVISEPQAKRRDFLAQQYQVNVKDYDAILFDSKDQYNSLDHLFRNHLKDLSF